MFTGQSDEDSAAIVKFSPPVYIQRYEKTSDVLEDDRWRGKIHKVVDFGCAELQFFKYLKNLKGVNCALAVDFDKPLLERFHERVAPLISNYVCERDEPLSVFVLHGSVAQPDYRLIGCDAVVCIELIEHLDADVLEEFPNNVFGFIEPLLVVITTPNADFNVVFPQLRNGGFRHWDHRFEWTRAQFQHWANFIISKYTNYFVEFHDVGLGGEETKHLGGCSQMAIFIHKNYIKKDDIVVPQNDLNLSMDMDMQMKCIEHYFNKLNFVEPNNIQQSNNIIAEKYNTYQKVADYHYPYVIDTRTIEEKLLHEAKYRINLFSFYESPLYDEENDLWKIPIKNLIKPMNEDLPTDELTLGQIMRNNGYQVENNILIYRKVPEDDEIDEGFEIDVEFCENMS